MKSRAIMVATIIVMGLITLAIVVVLAVVLHLSDRAHARDDGSYAGSTPGAGI
jgi:hypothetical protein